MAAGERRGAGARRRAPLVALHAGESAGPARRAPGALRRTARPWPAGCTSRGGFAGPETRSPCGPAWSPGFENPVQAPLDALEGQRRGALLAAQGQAAGQHPEGLRAGGEKLVDPASRFSSASHPLRSVAQDARRHGLTRSSFAIRHSPFAIRL